MCAHEYTVSTSKFPFFQGWGFMLFKMDPESRFCLLDPAPSITQQIKELS